MSDTKALKIYFPHLCWEDYISAPTLFILPHASPPISWKHSKKISGNFKMPGFHHSARYSFFGKLRGR